VLHRLIKLASTKFHENSCCYVQADGLQDVLSRQGGRGGRGVQGGEGGRERERERHDKANKSGLDCTKNQYTRNKVKTEYNNPNKYL